MENKETLEEVAERLAKAFDIDNYKAVMELIIEGAKWQAERMYSEEEVFNLLMEFSSRDINSSSGTPHSIVKWFKQFKKK